MKLGDLPIGTIVKWDHTEYMILPMSYLLRGAQLLKEPNRVPVLSLTDLHVGWCGALDETYTIVN